MAAQVIGVRDDSLPATAPRCSECGATVVLPDRLPRRFYITCDDCQQAADAW